MPNQSHQVEALIGDYFSFDQLAQLTQLTLSLNTPTVEVSSQWFIPSGVECTWIHSFRAVPKQRPWNGKVLLCCHGNPAWSVKYSSLFAPLTAQGYIVLAPDWLGMGFSGPVSDSLTGEGFLQQQVSIGLQWLAAELEALKLETDIELSLMAHDWGGPLALLMAQQLPSVKHFFLMNSYWGLVRDIPWRIWLSARFNWMRGIDQCFGLFIKAALRMTTCRSLPRERRELLGLPYRYRRQRGGIRQFLNAIPWTPKVGAFDLLSPLESLESSSQALPFERLVLLWGMKDFCFSPSYLARLQQRFPLASVHSFHHSGHWLLEDSEAQQIVKVIEQELAP